MLAAVGNVGIDRRYSAGTVQDENESLLRDSAGGKVPRSAGLFTLVRVNSRGFKVVRWGHRIVSKANDARRCG